MDVLKGLKLKEVADTSGANRFGDKVREHHRSLFTFQQPERPLTEPTREKAMSREIQTSGPNRSEDALHNSDQSTLRPRLINRNRRVVLSDGSEDSKSSTEKDCEGREGD